MRHFKPVHLGNRPYRSPVPFLPAPMYRGASSSFLFRLIGMKRRDLVGTISNSAYAMRLETAPTGVRKCLFIFRIHHSFIIAAIVTL